MLTIFTTERILRAMNAQMNEAILTSRTLEESDTASRSSKNINGFMRRVRSVVAGLLLCATSVSAASAQDPVAQEKQNIVPKGSLVIAGGGDLPEEVTNHFLELAGGEKAKIVVIPTASAKADLPDATVDNFWYAKRKGIFRILHTRDRDVADKDEFVQPLKEATGVWISGGVQARLSAAYGGTKVETELEKLYQERGGVIGGTSAGAAVMTNVMIEGGDLEAKIGRGFGFLKGNRIIDQHFSKRGRQGRLKHAMYLYPGYEGIGIDEGTALVITQGKICVAGAGGVWYCVSNKDNMTEEFRIFKAGEELFIPSVPMNVAGTMEE